MTSLQEISRIVLIGCGATLIMDIWLMLLKKLGVPTLNFASAVMLVAPFAQRIVRSLVAEN